MAGCELYAITIIEVGILRQFAAPRYDPAVATVVTGASFKGSPADPYLDRCSRVDQAVALKIKAGLAVVEHSRCIRRTGPGVLYTHRSNMGEPGLCSFFKVLKQWLHV